MIKDSVCKKYRHAEKIIVRILGRELSEPSEDLQDFRSPPDEVLFLLPTA